ncbi:MAG: DUF349 domain-containing protein [Cytophagia bacterium]|nr:MAG: DUF349 domain-containing protein [Cytophagales bacterium]TAG02409.1 MAG: DUF349 domain-containing protein [Cytophagia bacterium]TAG41639.1 MAG: DUF349 domain-containing protein [Cytophagia bacterium]TAH28333.1 MAG: DUF349 domain-containing protein [Cytophagales bacterium]
MTTEEVILDSANNAEVIAHQSDTTVNDTHEDDADESNGNYNHYKKADFLKLVKDLAESSNFKKTSGILREVKPLFDELINNEKEIALQSFIAEGGEKDNFEYKEDKDTKEFYQIYAKIQKQRFQHSADLEKQKETNLQTKLTILDKIRTIVMGEETKDSLGEVRKLQKEFRNIGVVPPAQTNEIWDNYRALIDQFDNKQSLYNELRELDRRKNLEQKVLLCEKAEVLINAENIRKAVKDLNELHEEFKHIGPAPKDEQENIWNRFKLASDKIYDKKRELQKGEDGEKIQNLAKKDALYEKILPYIDFKSQKITEWNDKTKELLDIQKEWDTIRFIPREAIKESSRKFWVAFKAFFANKNAFIQILDAERDANLAKKIALCEQAELLAKSEETTKNEIADKLKGLQRQWKEIGAVPQKQQQSIYDRFKTACDGYFEKVRNQFNDQEKGYEDNLKLKKDLCEKVANYKGGEGDNHEEKLQEFIKEWRTIGFVPRKHKDSIQEKFDKILSDAVAKLPVSEDEKEKIQVAVELATFGESATSQKRVQERSSALRRKIQKMETDIDTLRNNMGFLAKSNKADKLRSEVQKQIDEAESKLTALKRQIKLYQSLENKK